LIAPFNGSGDGTVQLSIYTQLFLPSIMHTPIRHLLISGTGGFVGTNLIPYLKHQLPDVKITHLSRTRPTQPTDDSYVLWSELSTASLQEVDAVIHLAGKAHDTQNTSAPHEYFDINYGLTKQLYDWYLQQTATKFIFLSSVKAAADRVSGVLEENITPDPKTPYGQSKLKAETHIISASAGVSANDKKYYILRPCMIHGPGNKGNLNLLYQFAAKGWPYPLADFSNKRSFLSIENLSFVITQLLKQEVASGIFHLADDEPLSTNDLIRIMSGVMNKPARLLRLPQSFVTSIAGIGDLLRLPLNKERLKKLTESYVVSNKKIKAALHIDQLPIAAAEGMITTIKSFK